MDARPTCISVEAGKSGLVQACSMDAAYCLTTTRSKHHAKTEQTPGQTVSDCVSLSSGYWLFELIPKRPTPFYQVSANVRTRCR